MKVEFTLIKITKMKLYAIIPIVLLLSCQSCGFSDTQNKQTEEKQSADAVKKTNSRNQNLNISLFLDLSDRISPTKYPNQSMEYYQRDLGYISSISKAFNLHVRSKKIIQMNDRIQIFFDPAPSNPEINSLAKQLKIELTKDNVTKDKLSRINSDYSNLTKQIYELAISDNHYIGSDIWRFFKSNAKDYCIKEGYRNILVIFTDGYVYHEDTKLMEGNKSSYLTPSVISKFGLNKSNWNQIMADKDYSFITPTSGLDSVEILVLGINPSKNNPYEEDVIKSYWNNWFDKMGVKKYLIRTTDLPSNLDEVIQDFILNG